MPTLHIEHRFTDLATWLAAFDSWRTPLVHYPPDRYLRRLAIAAPSSHSAASE